MRLGYIHIDKAGPSEPAQVAALREAGVVGEIHRDAPKKRPKPGTDPRPDRTEAIRALRPGDELAIHSAGRLASTREDVLACLDAIGRQGAAVYDCQAAEVIRPAPDASALLRFADRAAVQGKQGRAAKARSAITHRAGPPKVLAGKDMAEAKRLWLEPEISVAKIAERLNVAPRTLYRALGPRGTPRFGRKA